MGYYGITRDVIADSLEAIADALAGTEKTSYTGNQDRVRHALDRIAEYFGDNTPATGTSIPEPKEADKGKYLMVDSTTGKPVWSNLPAPSNDNGTAPSNDNGG